MSSGTYTCVASTDITGIATESGYLKVIGMQPSAKESSNILSYERTHLEIKCGITGIPTATKVWYKVRRNYAL